MISQSGQVFSCDPHYNIHLGGDKKGVFPLNFELDFEGGNAPSMIHNVMSH